MELTQDITTQTAIEEGLTEGISYSQYRDEVSNFVDNDDTSGTNKTEALINYTMLNDRRMKRWDKTIKVSDEVKECIAKFKGNVTWLVLTESWCGDAAQVLPFVNKVAELSNNIDLKLVYRDENEALMDAFLTNGGRSIPKLIMIDNTSGNVLDTYGPRPSIATQLVNEFKETYGILTPEFKEELQLWYNKDKGHTTIQDLLELLKV
ncbi:thioredoxin family protein [Subsaxibacter sp. CAU 1640]|uniref:thioredoxin family protein n=1 Tax=Subsaxibacter sp. CAU 1640 TaxID=2933271 RepID=UPI002004529E|nr:thioredoxin family protein [Subsaxibacter sp. CAU 1640]MCK7589178.1 thioredoxin family protein [Subsaxibacter sp. CAU 1640]